MKILRVIGFDLAALIAGGCGSVGDMFNDQKIYGGIRFDVERIPGGLNFGPCPSCGPCWILDLPFSLAADTLLLPVTVIMALTRDPSKSDDATKK